MNVPVREGVRMRTGRDAPEEEGEQGTGLGALKEREGREGQAGLGNCNDALEIGTGPSDLAKEATESSLKTWENFLTLEW